MFNPKTDLKDTKVISDSGMESLLSKVLKAIARANGIQGWAQMTKAKLLEALQPVEIILENLRVTELRPLAKLRGVEGYKTINKPELLEALSALIPEVEVPLRGVSKPPGKLIFTSLKRLMENASEAVMFEVNKFEEWVLSKAPELGKNRSNKIVRKRINKKVKELKKKIKDEFDKAIEFIQK